MNLPSAKKHHSERRRSNTTKAFKEILIEAKKSSNWIWERSESNNLHEFTVITDQVSRYKAEIKSCPPCTCPYFQKEKKFKSLCKHIVATLLKKFKLSDNSMLLPQLAFTQNEVEYLLDKHNTSVKKASKFSKKQKKTPSVSCLLNKNQFLRQMKVIKTFKNDYLTNLLKEKMRNVALVEVPYSRTRFMYT